MAFAVREGARIVNSEVVNRREYIITCMSDYRRVLD
jgi:hypothetical protein